MEPVDLLHRHEAAFVILGWCRERIANVFVDSPHLQSNLHAGGGRVGLDDFTLP
jgi:hypothetical protein